MFNNHKIFWHVHWLCCGIALGILFQNRGRWQNRDPVAWTAWRGYRPVHQCIRKWVQHITPDDPKRNRKIPLEEFPQSCFNCTALLLSNRATAHWISVECQKTFALKYEYNVLAMCLVPKNAHFQRHEVESVPDDNYCLQDWVLKQKMCYKFVWHRKLSQIQSSKLSCHTNESFIQFVLSSVSLNSFPPICDHNCLILTSYSRYFMIFKAEPMQSATEGICIESFLHSKISSKGNLFVCNSKAFVSAQFVCDRVPDCPGADQTDEKNCNCSLSKPQPPLCAQFLSDKSKKRRRCSPLFYATHKGDCVLFLFTESGLRKELFTINGTEEHIKTLKENSTEFLCNTGTMSTGKVILNDLVVDCPPDGKDEPMLKAILMSNTFHKCNRTSQIPCKEGHSRCYDISKVCLYTLNKYRHLSPCRTGEHLQNCSKFECSRMFKCPKYYCLSWKLVCNGIWECPYGTDEVANHQCGFDRSCTWLYKCRKEQLCIHFDSVCDNHNDCVFADDEDLCLLRDLQCPYKCHCLTFAVVCDNVLDTHTNYYSVLFFKVIFVQGSRMLISVFFDHQKVSSSNSVMHLSVTHSNMRDLCSLNVLTNSLKELVVSFNVIAFLKGHCFAPAKFLLFVDISHNSLSRLTEFVFADLHCLKYINLSSNPVQEILPNTFTNLSQFALLSVLNISYHSGADDTLSNLELKILHVGVFQLCCLKPDGAQCSMNIPWYISCTGLLPQNAIRITFYCISIWIIVLNILSLISQNVTIKKGSEKTGAGASVAASVSVADMFCSLPLIYLWIADLIYKGNFMKFEDEWSVGASCHIVSFLFLNFCLISPLSLCLLSVSRLMVVLHPMDSGFKKTSFVRICILVVNLVSLCVSCFFTLLTWLIDHHIFGRRNLMSLCSPFIDPSKEIVLVKVITWFTTIFQVASAIIILTVYVLLIVSLRKSQKGMESAVSHKMSSVALVVQVFVLTSSNILCWIPSAVIYLLSMFVEQYPVEMVVWTTIIVTPLNSLINPLVFVVIALRKLTQKLNICHLWKYFPPLEGKVESRKMDTIFYTWWFSQVPSLALSFWSCDWLQHWVLLAPTMETGNCYASMHLCLGYGIDLNAASIVSDKTASSPRSLLENWPNRWSVVWIHSHGTRGSYADGF